ncbi:hypothetical protein GCM10028805_59090 [Spirosoma harenae]
MLSLPTDVVLIILLGTVLFLSLGGFITLLLFVYKQRYKAHQQELITLQETAQRELLQSQLEVQNQTLQQIARELHDNIGQLLSVVVMRLNTLEDETEAPSSQESIQETRDLVRKTIAEVRMLSKTLDHDTVGRFGLLPSLRLELERIQRAGKLETELSVVGDDYSLDEKTEMVLLRMTQESLNNALKHAKASKLQVIADYTSDTFRLAIVDDGAGFNVSEATSRTIDQSGAGLTNLYHRAKLLGGSCTIESQPGAGTSIEIQLPHSKTE